jgi:predicted nuclease of restriction endonuclease-like RecB superfamily
MLPLNLLIARTRKGFVKPVYASLDQANLEIAQILIELFRASIGKKKGEILEEVRGYEELGFDYRFIRGLSTILERRCLFETKSSLDPGMVRRLLFQESCRLGIALTKEKRLQALSSVAKTLGVTPEEIEESLWGDLEEELILREFRPLEPKALLKYYNLCLTQTLLLRSTFLEFTVRGNWKFVFRRIKHLGLMYSAEARPEGFYVVVDGPLSLFKLTERYGASIAKLLPSIIEAGGWRLRASIVGGRAQGGEGGRRLLHLELREEEVGSLLEDLPEEREALGWQPFDSFIEEEFARSFESAGLGWRLVREPEPLVTGSHVMIPDFSFEKEGMKVYMEVVGFWTPEYLDRKLSKLRQLPKVDMIVAVDRRLGCSKLESRPLRAKVLFYEDKIPLKPIIEHLRSLEEKIVAQQVEGLGEREIGTEIGLEGAFVELDGLAKRLGVSEEALRKSLQRRMPKGYRLIGKELVREEKLAEIAQKLAGLKDMRLKDAIRLIEEEGCQSPYNVLEALGYGIRWQGLDVEKAIVFKKAGGLDGR